MGWVPSYNNPDNYNFDPPAEICSCGAYEKMKNRARIQDLKKELGVDQSNCKTCRHLKGESDDEYGSNFYYYCSKRESFSWLKSFPFKKDMDCWEPTFWATKLGEDVDWIDGAGANEAHAQFNAILNRFERN
jgi:hypothetical protein